MNLRKIFPKIPKWHLSMRVIPILVIILIAKVIMHYYHLEIVSLNALFTSLIAATTFLIGFLITGVISDYKESEKIPGDIVASLEALHDEAYIAKKNNHEPIASEFISFHEDFVNSIKLWLHRQERTKNLLAKLHLMNDYFARFEGQIQPNFLARMKNEQSNLRRQIIRVDNIRDLSFIQSAYAIAEILAFFVIIGLLILKVEPFYESVFFTMVVSFLVVYMIFLIKDLDNPFDYSDSELGNGTEVSLKPIYDLITRLKDD